MTEHNLAFSPHCEENLHGGVAGVSPAEGVAQDRVTG